LANGAVDPAFNVEGAAQIEWPAKSACMQNSSVLVLGNRNGRVQLIRLLTASVSDL